MKIKMIMPFGKFFNFFFLKLELLWLFYFGIPVSSPDGSEYPF